MNTRRSGSRTILAWRYLTHRRRRRSTLGLCRSAAMSVFFKCQSYVDKNPRQVGNRDVNAQSFLSCALELVQSHIRVLVDHLLEEALMESILALTFAATKPTRLKMTDLAQLVCKTNPPVDGAISRCLAAARAEKPRSKN